MSDRRQQNSVERLPNERRLATLVAFVLNLEAIALDDALDLLDILITDIFSEAKNAGERARLRRIKDLDAAAIELSKVCRLILDPSVPDVVLTLVHSLGLGDRGALGTNRFAHEGLLRKVIAAGTLHPRFLRVPGILVDAVVQDSAQQQFYGLGCDPGICGARRVHLAQTTVAVPDKLERRIIARRAALELRNGASLNFGFGIPGGIFGVIAEQGKSDDLWMSVEQGVHNGRMLDDRLFGAASNPLSRSPICTVTSSLISRSVISKFCAPAWIKPLRKPITPSPARASPEPVSHAERVTNQVPCRSKVLTSSAVRMPSFSTGGTSSRFQASMVVCVPAKANPLRCIGRTQRVACSG